MKNQTIIYCEAHAQESIAKCSNCRDLLCIDCMIQHQSTGHHYKKLTMIAEDYIQKFNQYIDSFADKLVDINKKQQQSLYSQKIEKGIKIIQLCKYELVELIEKHFQQFKEQFSRVMFALCSQPQTKNIQELINDKIEEYKTFINEIKVSIYKVNDLEDNYHYDEDYNLMLHTIDKKIEEMTTVQAKNIEFPKIKYDESALFKFNDYLSQIIGFTFTGKQLKKSKKIQINDLPIQKNKETCQITHFLEGTTNMFVYNIKNRKCMKINFRDFYVPMKSKSLTTASGKIFLIGGQKLSTRDKTIKYLKDIWIFDKKFQMMKIVTSMKQGRIMHILVSGPDSINFKNEVIYIFGGKNQRRLKSLIKFDFNKNQLTQLAPYTASLGGASAISIKSKIYFFGGVLQDQINKHIIIYDIELNIWNQILPINPVNYLPCIQPVLTLINKDNILIMGGCRKQNTILYATNIVQSYNFFHNFFSLSSTQSLPINLYKSQSFQFYEGNYYYTVQTQRESQSYGPNLPSILKFQYTREHYTIQSFLEC